MSAGDLPPDALAWNGLDVAPTIAELTAEAEAAGAADPIAAFEWSRLSRLERERIMHDASAFRAAHDRRVAELGPLARAAHEDACILCEEEAAA